MPDDSSSESRWTVYQFAIAILMVTTGSVNTLAAKWADMLEADGRKFDHPFLQAVCMFIGEFLCLPAFAVFYLIRKWQYSKRERAQSDLGPINTDGDVREVAPITVTRFNPLIFLPATLCDMCATSIMYVGLELTNAASFQMLRGSVIVFTGLLSVAFLRSVLRCYKWVGMLGVVLGLVIVGLSDILFGSGIGKDRNSVISGDLLIIMAQVIVAIQMVYEQKFVLKYDVHPLLAVGFEGLFGMTILSILLVPFYYIKVPKMFSDDPDGRLENALAAFHQMADNKLIIVALLGTIASIAFFNFAGISVTKELSATTRMILDSVRTLVIWAVSLGLRWQNFVPLQILGFVLLIVGMMVYNDLVFGPLIRNRLIPYLDSKGIWVPACCKLCCIPDLPREGAADDEPLGPNMENASSVHVNYVEA